MPPPEFSHFDPAGAARMVEVGGKPETARSATASGVVTMLPDTLARILAGQVGKGDVLGVARIAGILAAKKTSELIPLCHGLPLTSVEVEFRAISETELRIGATARVIGRTGVEMEALVAVSVAGLTVYDMAKALDKGMTLSAIRLEAKSGGRSGDYSRDAEPAGES